MAEFGEYQPVYSNGQPVNGRTVRRENGTYESIDLQDTTEGESITIATESGLLELHRVERGEYGSALDGWQVGSRAVRLSLGEKGFLHHGIVLREGLDVGAVYAEGDKPNVIRALGTVASLLSWNRTDQQPVEADLISV